jgi:predicted DNA binding CopG/RHH family protein
VTPKLGQKLIPDSERKSHLVAVRLTEEEFQALEAISAKEELPISRYIREGVAYIIRKYSKQK